MKQCEGEGGVRGVSGGLLYGWDRGFFSYLLQTISVVKQWGTAFRYINRPLLARLVLSMTFFLDGFTSARCRLSHGYFVLVIENM